MSTITRREFVVGAAVAGSALVGDRFLPAAEQATKIKRGNDLAPLGNTSLKTTILGIGTGGIHGGWKRRSQDFDDFTRLVRHGLDRGLRFIDTADGYGTHEHIRRALEGVPRDRYFLQTKISPKDARKAEQDIDRFLKEMHVEYLDTLLIHCLQNGDWPNAMRPIMDAIQDVKAKGKIKAYGISSHGWASLAASVESDWPEVQLVRINPFGQMMDGPPEKVVPLIQKLRARGRGVIGMKIFAGTGFDSVQRRLESLRYVLKLGCVDCFTIGFVSAAQLDDTMDLIESAQA